MQVCIAVLCLAVGISIGILAFSGRSGQISQIEPTASPSATATPNNGQSTTPNTGSSNLADVIDSVMPSVVSITTTQYAQRAGTEVASGYGSGFVYSADGLIATNNHVVEGAGRIYVTLNGDEQQYEAEVVATDSYSDLAILKLTDRPYTRQVRLFQQPKAGRYGLCHRQPVQRPVCQQRFQRHCQRPEP